MDKYLNPSEASRAAKPRPTPPRNSSYESVYAITISYNKATDPNSYLVYDYVISRLPGKIHYTKEHSKHGKYHVHGILQTNYKLFYKQVQQAKETIKPYLFDVHVKYELLREPINLTKWWNYMLKETFTVETKPCEHNPPQDTCVPEIIQQTNYKSIKITGL